MSSIVTNYDKIYSRFLSIVSAYDLKNMLEEDAYELLTEWLHSVRSEPLFRRKFKTISMSDEGGLITYELKSSFGSQEDDEEYVIELFALGVANRWVKPKYYNVLNTAQVFTGKEIKYYAQANHMNSLENMYKGTQKDFYSKINQYGFINNTYLNSTYLNGGD